ncbi:MAG TPA: 4Fe-4S binding protein [Anaerolineaceae bacterium]|nr:4Fe-4S binding protein [Anaerolineaceae bacterium]
MSIPLSFSFKKLIVPAVVALAFLTLGAVLWQVSGYWIPLALFGYIGVSLGLGLGLYAALPKGRKPLGRKLTLFLVGAFLFGFVALAGQENMQIEGFFFGLMTGVVQAAVMHYLIAKVFGPLLFGRLWCGWACWTVMVLDLLPFTKSSGRRPGKWGWLRYAHFGLSLGLVALLVFGAGYRDGVIGNTGILWFLGGNLLYYALGITLAYALKDNRAFCKYACPISLLLKLTARFSLLKIGGKAERCTGCEACARACPMDIQVYAYVQQGQRVLSTECTLCQTCVSACAQDTLKITAGFDVGNRELLRERG